MISVIDSKEILKQGINSFLKRDRENINDIKDYTKRMINDVKSQGDSALYDFSEKFEKIDLKNLGIKVTQETIDAAYNLVPEDLIQAIKSAIKNIKIFHKSQLREDWVVETTQGVKTGQILRPLDSVGIYIPGGRAAYVSSVIMTAIPAVTAGVEKIILCSPPGESVINGNLYIGINPAILVAACECGISEIYNIGGAWSIAAMAYGTETVPSVLKIVGPGNKYVNMAKKLVKDIVDIDNPAGPSEVLIIADISANPEFIAYDLISQVEHDPENIGILLCDSDEIIKKVIQFLSKIIPKAERRQIIQDSLENNG